VNEFFNEEKLFWRCKDFSNINPFKTIRLADVSVNRSGSEEVFFSEAQDVLWNIFEDQEQERYAEHGFIVLSIMNLGLNEYFVRKYQETLHDVTVSAEMQLIHDPLLCNRAHSMLRFTYEGNTVKFEDYKKGFGKKSPKALERLRRVCKDELLKIIVSKVVNFDK